MSGMEQEIPVEKRKDVDSCDTTSDLSQSAWRDIEAERAATINSTTIPKEQKELALTFDHSIYGSDGLKLSNPNGANTDFNAKGDSRATYDLTKPDGGVGEFNGKGDGPAGYDLRKSDGGVREFNGKGDGPAEYDLTKPDGGVREFDGKGDGPAEYDLTKPDGGVREFDGKGDGPAQYEQTRPNGAVRDFNRKGDGPAEYEQARPNGAVRNFNANKTGDGPAQYDQYRPNGAARTFNENGDSDGWGWKLKGGGGKGGPQNEQSSGDTPADYHLPRRGSTGGADGPAHSQEPKLGKMHREPNDRQRMSEALEEAMNALRQSLSEMKPQWKELPDRRRDQWNKENVRRMQPLKG